MRYIYVKILIGILVILIVNVVINTFLLIRFIRKDYENNMFEELYTNAVVAKELIETIGLEENNYRKIDRSLKKLGQSLGLRVTVILSDGKVVADSFFDPLRMANHLSRDEVQSAIKNGIGKSSHLSSTLRIPMTYLAIPFHHEDKIAAVIRVAFPKKIIDQKIYSTILKSVLYGVFAGGIIAIIIAFFVARLYSKPIEMIKDAAVNISHGNFNYKLKLKRKDELSQLAENLNEMSNKLNQYFESLNEETERISAILTGINEPLILIGVNEIIYLANSAFCKMFNISDKSYEEKKYFEVISNEGVINFIKSSLEYPKPDEYDASINFNSEHIRHFRLSSSPIISQKGPFRGIVVIFHDITFIKEMENMRSEFVDNASHELKTPLSAILLTIETLLEKEPTDLGMRKKFYQTMFDNTTRLHNLINDMLDLSEIEHKRATLEYTPQNLSVLISEIVEVFSPSINAKNHQIQINIPEDLPDIKVDKKIISKAIGNIIDNAIRYTDNGGKIKVYIEKELFGVNIIIEDNGIGISQQDINRVFERFYRVDKTRSIKSGGTGLGLSIAKHIIEAHGGNIKVLSTIGNGSKFIIYLPFNV